MKQDTWDKKFNKIFNEWLWSDDKTRKSYNPFLEYMAKVGRNVPEVNQVEKYDSNTKLNK